MSTSLLTLVADGGYAAIQAAIQRLRSVWFPIIQTSVASGLAWYIAADVLDHPQPFFAPIASAVCLSISNVLRAQRAVQMMIGVSLGIWIGGVVHGLFGTGVVPIAVAVLVSLPVAVVIGRGFIGQGMMFVNQTVVSSILVLALYRGGAVNERLDDALVEDDIGGDQRAGDRVPARLDEAGVHAGMHVDHRLDFLGIDLGAADIDDAAAAADKIAPVVAQFDHVPGSDKG